MHNCTQHSSLLTHHWIPPEMPVSDSSLLLPMSPLLSWISFESMHFPPPQTSLKFLYAAQLNGSYNINIHSSVNITSTAVNKTPQSPVPRTMRLSDLSLSGRQLLKIMLQKTSGFIARGRIGINTSYKWAITSPSVVRFPTFYLGGTTWPVIAKRNLRDLQVWLPKLVWRTLLRMRSWCFPTIHASMTTIPRNLKGLSQTASSWEDCTWEFAVTSFSYSDRKGPERACREVKGSGIQSVNKRDDQQNSEYPMKDISLYEHWSWLQNQISFLFCFKHSIMSNLESKRIKNIPFNNTLPWSMQIKST